jgi:CheY-like chemotaxis protein
MGWNDEKQPIILLHSSVDTAQLYSQSKILAIRYKLTKPIIWDDLLTYLKEIKQPSQTQVKGNSEGGTAQQQATLFADATPVILVAEDVALNFLLIKTLLKNLLPNCIVLEAKTGKEALEKNNEENPDLILMDIHMPEMDGLKATELIRAQEAHLGKHTPIVALTAGALKEEQEKCSKAGMDDFLTKPISKEKLTDFLYKFLTNQYQTHKRTTS